MSAHKPVGEVPRHDPTSPSGLLAPLDLHQLRRHRGRLTAEDDRIAYWRCLAGVRIAALASESRTANSMSLEQLVRVLGEAASGETRRLIELALAGRVLPELPMLSLAWTEDLPTGARSRAAHVLGAAVRSLSAYEEVLHALMDDAKRELLLRYREDPNAALDVLPG